MPGVVPKFVGGPITCRVLETVKGGQLVEARTAAVASPGIGNIGVAAAASVKVLGVATKDARVPASNETTDTFGNVTVDVTQITEFTAVGVEGVYPVLYSANAAFGDPLVATANGTVAPAGVTPDARTIVGRCWEPGGVVFATNPLGLVKING